MQEKTIKDIISKKMDEWLQTITDSELRNDTRKNIIVTGGCIATLFLGEPVNDFDVYIEDINVLERIIQYYIKGTSAEMFDGRMKQKLVDQLESDYSKLDKETYDELQFAKKISLNNLKEDQLKLFFHGNAGAEYKPENDKDGNPISYQLAFLSPNAISLTDDLQIVIRFHGDAKEIHKNYDFVHATNYFTFKDGLVTNVPALTSLLTKQLKYQGSLYPVTSVIRLKKFLKRGFNVNAGEIFKIIFQCSLLDLTNPEVLEEQLIGVDIAYFNTFIDALRDVKSDKIDYTYISKIIDRIFN